MKENSNKGLIILAVILVIGLLGGLVAIITLNNDINAAKEYIASGNYAQAEVVLEKQLKTNDNQQELYVLYADCLIAKGEYIEALKLLEEGETKCNANNDIGAKISDIKRRYADKLDNDKDKDEDKDEEITVPNDTPYTDNNSDIAKEPETSHGVPVSVWDNIAPAIDAIGVPLKDVYLSKIDDWAEGERYSFNYEELRFRIYLNADGTVNSINNGNTKFYVNGAAVYNANDYVIGDNRFQLIVWAQDAVLANLKSPSTAEFAPVNDHVVTRNGNVYSISGYVDAQNSFGAMIRNKFTITMSWSGSGNPTITDIVFQ